MQYPGVLHITPQITTKGALHAMPLQSINYRIHALFDPDASIVQFLPIGYS